MKISCPFKKLNLLVNVFDQVCDAADLCNFGDCHFHDNSREATKRYIQASSYYETIEGLLEKLANPDLQLQRRPPEAYVHEHEPKVTH